MIGLLCFFLGGLLIGILIAEHWANRVPTAPPIPETPAPVAIPSPVRSNPAATADIAALRKAIAIVNGIEVHIRQDCSVMTPEWWFLCRVRRHLEDQLEAAFRWTLVSDGKGEIE